MNNNFDIKAYLDSKEIEYKTSGENVTKGWIEICCIIPRCSDHKEHLGINLKSLKFKCWLCGAKGHAIYLVQLIEKCSRSTAQQIIKKFPLDENPWEEEPPPIINNLIQLPEEIQTEWPQIHLDYLRSRNFDLSIISKYNLKPVWLLGQYRFRIIIPIYTNYQLVSYTSMDVLRDGTRPPYMDCPIEKAIIPVKECLYNIDQAKDKILIFEGVTGVWRFGDGAVASFTSNLTKEQINLLIKKKLKKVFVLFDPDAEKKGEVICNQLSGIIPYVEQIKFKSGDPKDLFPNEIIDLKKNLGF